MMADEARPPDPRTPLPRRDPKRGDVRAEGAPQRPPMLPWSGRRFLLILAVLFFLNWLIVAIFAPAEERIKVPYNPTFLTQVRDGNVEEISSRGETVQGTFREQVRHEGEEAEKFETEIPTFANERELSQLLERENVTINAEPPGERSLLETILFSFGPTLLLVALFIFFLRRAAGAGGAGGALGQFGRSRAKLVESEKQTVNFDDVAGGLSLQLPVDGRGEDFVVSVNIAQRKLDAGEDMSGLPVGHLVGELDKLAGADCFRRWMQRRS
jgi:cell division protease FtsH